MSAAEVFAALGGDFVQPRVVVEAALPLELSGEAVRGRICVFTDEEGREWALRPDLTLPVAVDEVVRRRSGAGGERVVRYAAPVFRLPALPGEPVEFEQAGFERFGGPSDAASDASVFAAITAACEAAGVSAGEVRLGDISVFSAFVDGLDLSLDVQQGLKRAFRQEGGVRAFLETGGGRPASGLAQRMQGMSRDEIGAFTQDIFALTGIRPVGERSADEIVERLHQRAQGSEAVPESAQAVLETVLGVDAPVSEAAAQLRAIGDEAGLSGLGPVLERLDARLSAMAQATPGFMAQARFATRFGRRFTYYDGFVFEISASETEREAGRPFAAGGRYDSLLSDLSGGEVEACAVGAVIVPHRLARVAGETS